MMTESGSRLGRLFTYSKDTAFIAQENFTTEALAMAIADDPAPIVEALSRLNAVRAEALSLGIRGIRPRTQVSVPGAGWLDLVLEVRDERQRLTAEVWIEVKIDAPESGLQLDAYGAAANTQAHPVWLLTLAKEPIRKAFENLAWNELYQAAKRHGAWSDLRKFLKEKMVASDALGPISDREAGSLEAAYELTQKVSEVLRIVHQQLPDQFEGPSGARLRWSAEGSFLNFIGNNFRATGELVGVGGPLTYGLRSEEGSAKWFIALRQGSATRSSAEIVRVTAEQASSARLTAATRLSNWERPQVGPTIAEITVRATALDSRQAAIDWIQGGLRELAASGVVDVLLGPLATSVPIASSDLPGDGSPAIEP